TLFDAAQMGALGTRSHTYADGPNKYTGTIKVTDKDGGIDSQPFKVTVANLAPAITSDLSTPDGKLHAQYSDPIPAVTITATDMPVDNLQVSASTSRDGGAAQAGLPAGLGLAPVAG